MKTGRRGSVLMELIVVFPIYLVLFGGLFMIGDMLIKVARLPSAERCVAFELGDGTNLRTEIRTLLYHDDREVNDRGDAADLIEADTVQRPGLSEHYADTVVQGPFSLRAAVKLRDGYYLPGGVTRGQLAYADWFFGDTVGAERASGDMATLLNGTSRVNLRSKDNSTGRVRYYNYYTLKRFRAGGGDWRMNGRKASDLLVNLEGRAQHWKDVAEEIYHYDNQRQELDQSNQATAASSARSDAEYTRYAQYVKWSD